MAKKTDEVAVEGSAEEAPVQTQQNDAVVIEAPVQKSAFDMVSNEKIEDYFIQLASYVEQVNNGSMKKNTAIYLAWKILSEIK
jgi:menaquinone-dependent protoporphyrinogen IX oxidase